MAFVALELMYSLGLALWNTLTLGLQMPCTDVAMLQLLHVHVHAEFVHYVYMYNMCFYSHHVQFDKTPLHYAAGCGHTEVVKCLVENTTAQVNAKDRVSH